jgi:hypothetical protein
MARPAAMGRQGARQWPRPLPYWWRPRPERRSPSLGEGRRLADPRVTSREIVDNKRTAATVRSRSRQYLSPAPIGAMRLRKCSRRQSPVRLKEPTGTPPSLAHPFLAYCRERIRPPNAFNFKIRVNSQSGVTMIHLHGWWPFWGLIDTSPFVMKVDTYLRLVKLPYKLIPFSMESLAAAPKGSCLTS